MHRQRLTADIRMQIPLGANPLNHAPRATHLHLRSSGRTTLCGLRLIFPQAAEAQAQDREPDPSMDLRAIALS